MSEAKSKPESLAEFRIDQVILERAFFEHRSDYLSEPSETSADLGALKVSIQAEKDTESEAVLIRTRLFTSDESRGLYKLDICYVILVHPAVATQALPMDRMLVTGAIFLVPFLRETVATLTSRGRFGPVWVQPLNLQNVIASAKTERSVAGDRETASRVVPAERSARKARKATPSTRKPRK